MSVDTKSRWLGTPTFEKTWDEAVRSAIYQIALSCNANGSQNIVSGAHNFTDSSLLEFVDHSSCAGFKLVFEDNEANELKVRFCFRTLHFLRLQPAQFGNVFSCTSNNPKTSVGIVTQQFIVVHRY